MRGIFSIPFLGLNAEGMPILMDADGQPCTGDIDFQETINLGFLKYKDRLIRKLPEVLRIHSNIGTGRSVSLLITNLAIRCGCMIISKASILI